MSTISVSELPRYLSIVLKSKLPAMIRGPHGCGKTESVRQVGREMGYVTRYIGPDTTLHSSERDKNGNLLGYIIEQRCSQMQEGDLLGMPSAKPTKVGGADATKWNPPAWLAFACTYPTLIFLDEVDRATGEVRQGIFQLLDSRCVGDMHLHPDSVVIAAINGGEFGSEYQVNGLDPAELSRWAVFDVMPAFPAWYEWATGPGEVSKLVTDFLMIHHNDHFAKYDQMDGVKKHPEPRSWFRFSQILKTGGWDLDRAKADVDRLIVIGAACVGLSSAGQWSKWLNEQENAITLEKALQDPEKFKKQMKKLKSAEEQQQRVIELCSQIAMSNLWLKYCNDDDDNLNDKGVIKASYFLEYMYEFMKENKELFFTFLHDFIFGIQTKYLAPIADNSSFSKDEKEKQVYDIIYRLKVLFAPGITKKQFNDKETMKSTKYSYDHKICKDLREIVEKHQEEINSWIEQKNKKNESN